MDQFLVKVPVDLGSKAANQHIHHIRLRVKMIIPDMLHNHGLGDHPSRLANEVFEQAEFTRLEFNFPAGSNDLPLDQVYRKIADRQPGGFGGPGGSPNQGLDPGQKF